MMNPLTSSHRPPAPETLDRLAQLLGPKGFTTDADVMQPWLIDWRGKYHGRAAAMLSPATTQEVAEIIALARDAGCALVPQGGNSGMVGGATPDASGAQLLLSLRRMNRIRSIDVEARSVVAEAGVILQTLHESSRGEGPALSSHSGRQRFGDHRRAGFDQRWRHASSTPRHNARVGRGGGGCSARRINIRWSRRALKKDNRGYDLKHLLCGAEGTLGIVTAARFRLVPTIIAERITGMDWGNGSLMQR